MSSSPSACITPHGSPSSRRDPCDPVGVISSQGGCLTGDRGQTLSPVLGLMEMSEVDYTHLHHLVQTHVAPPDLPAARSHPAAVTVKDTQAIDLSTTTDGLVMPGEKTPASYGEVPDFVLARVRGEDSPTEPCGNCSTSSQKRSRSAARVCLENRFNTLFADTPRQQDIQSVVFSNFLTILHESSEAQEAVRHPQMHTWMQTDRESTFGVSSPFVISHVPHMVESTNRQGLIIPQNLKFHLLPGTDVTNAHYTSGSNSSEQRQLMNGENDVATPAAFRKHGSTRRSQLNKAASVSAVSSTMKSAPSHMSVIQRRERHNSKERERRKRIRSYCDELNLLVPFCESDSDKVTTLQWTTAFLRYITAMYGDAFKEEFQKAFTDGKAHFLEPSPSLGPDPVHPDMDENETLCIPLVVEQ